MPRFIIDTYAWVDYFRGAVHSPRLKEIIEAGDNLTPTIVLAELKRKYTSERFEDFEDDLRFIRTKTEILPLDEETAILAGEIRAKIAKKGMGIVDCILIAVARLRGAKVLTGDEHFKGLPEAEFIAEGGTQS
jgi:predicted nucleic acid-binding protein